MTPEQEFDARRIRSRLATLRRTVLAGICLLPCIWMNAYAEDRSPTPAPPDFPPIDSASWKDGTFPSLDAIAQIQPGMDKDQVRSLLGSPHFNEGFVGVREWGYIFHFRRIGGPEVMTCQYMLRFSSEMRTVGAFWKTTECATFVDPRAQPRIAVKSIEAPMPLDFPPYTLTLSSEDIFRADEPDSAELQPDGVRLVELLAAEIRRKFRLPLSVSVIGFSARSTSEDDAKSLLKANAVRDVLIRYGIEATAVRVAAGSAVRTVAACDEAVAPRTRVACERSRQRIEIHVSGAQ